MTPEQQRQFEILAAVNTEFHYMRLDGDLSHSVELTVHEGIERWLRVQCLQGTEDLIHPFLMVSLQLQGSFVPICIGEGYRALSEEHKQTVRAAVLRNRGADAVEVMELGSFEYHFTGGTK